MTSVGIIGYGSFGKFLTIQLGGFFDVRVYDSEEVPSKWRASLMDVVASDYIVLAVPLSAYRNILNQIKPMISKRTVIVDVCSVKELPIETIKQMLPNQPLVALHPLFGPESASGGVAGFTVVGCPDVSTSPYYSEVIEFCEKVGLRVVEMTSSQHDREMAVVQGLTFFVARALKEFGLTDNQLTTPSFGRLLSLAELEAHHSEELFRTIQAGNKYAKPVRDKFERSVVEINEDIGASQAKISQCDA